ncbi:MAG: hypothetical protein EVA29_03145 [Candidatus Actinomarinales bacterium]|nr:MAG: hypothetical protein EVA29_03145 [Candidatus Actinomarinales bacterium]|tara:strand:+ start:123 stop:734 length:612 start_codon:yes stop_codon:yes gene_type:complete
MKISASILAADQNDIINNLNEKRDLFDYVHIDIGDNVFCPTYGISKDNVYKLVNDTTYKLDIHLMIDEFPELLNNLVKETNNIVKASHHVESNSINEFIDIMQKQNNIETGFGILGSSDLNILRPFLETENITIDYILLLCVNPGFSYQDPVISPSQRVLEFKNLYPNYHGQIMVDGGVSKLMLNELKDLGVNVSVQGGAIFG